MTCRLPLSVVITGAFYFKIRLYKQTIILRSDIGYIRILKSFAGGSTYIKNRDVADAAVISKTTAIIKQLGILLNTLFFGGISHAVAK
jgi:hypothetical protein